MIISTTSLNVPHEVIDVVMHHSAEKAGMFSGGLDLDSFFDKAKASIAEKARSKGGNGVIGLDFEVRVLPDGRTIEIFAFGTVVKV